MAQTAKQNCEICMSARGNAYCLDCNQHFCTNCKGSHLRIAVCKNHRFKDSSNALSDSLIICQEHNEGYTFICEPCKLPVCRVCIVKTHKGHAMSDIEETVTTERSNFQTSVHTILNSEAVQKLDTMENTVKDLETKLSEDVNTAIQAIKKDGDILKEAVDSAVQETIRKVQRESDKEKADLNQYKTETIATKKVRDSLREKEIEIRTRRCDVSLLNEIEQLGKTCMNISVPNVPTPSTVIYHNINADVSKVAIVQLLGKVEITKQARFVQEENVLSGEVFEIFLSHGTKFRNAISKLEDCVLQQREKDTNKLLILFYKIQMMNEWSSSFVPKTINVFIETMGRWNQAFRRSLDDLNNAAPGLNLQMANRSDADLVIKSYSSDKIGIRWEKVSSRYVAIIEIGEDIRVTSDQEQAVATFEILYALGFYREMMRLYCTLASVSVDSVNIKSIVKKFDPYSILLYGSNIFEKGLREGFCSLKVEIGETVYTLSELDKVGLNLLFPPCPTAKYQPKLSSSTKLLYCGRRVMQDHNRPMRSFTDGNCGPTNGANCPACRTIIDKKTKMTKCIKNGQFQGWSGLIYCGKYLFPSSCGPSFGIQCVSCEPEME